MKLVILDTSGDVSEWAATYVVKRITKFEPGPEKLNNPTFPLVVNFQNYFSSDILLLVFPLEVLHLECIEN